MKTVTLRVFAEANGHRLTVLKSRVAKSGIATFGKEGKSFLYSETDLYGVMQGHIKATQTKQNEKEVHKVPFSEVKKELTEMHQSHLEIGNYGVCAELLGILERLSET